MDHDEVKRRFDQIGEALDDDNPALLAVVVRANGEQLLFTYPLLDRRLERGEVQDMLTALDRVGRAFDIMVDRLVGIERHERKPWPDNETDPST